MKIWLDDVRPAPEGWNHCKKAEEAFWYIMNAESCLGDRVTELSFDHDLGAIHTGYDLARWIEALAYNNRIPAITWKIHSANPVGRKNIEMAMQNADRYWEQHAESTRISEDQRS